MITWEVVNGKPKRFEHILSPEALAFVAELQGIFGMYREQFLTERTHKQVRFDAGKMPHFREDTVSIRYDEFWRVAPIPADLVCRKVEITGPASKRSMVVNAENSGADCYMADAEDSDCPTLSNVLQGQLNMYDLVRRQIDFKDEKTGKEYKLNDKIATLMFRPRGWHLLEKNILVNGRPMSASLFDFGIYFFHNAKELMERGSGPYFYLPKLENYEEARLWNDVFVFAQRRLGVPQGTIRATVLIETILAAFEMEEILYALKNHSAGLNCGRWDYIFSYIKKFRKHPGFILPDRAQVTMDRDFLKAYCVKLIQVCHKRGAHAMGGMAAQIPLKDPEANKKVTEKILADKRREVEAGHDGTWVPHPGTVAIARQPFDEVLGDKPNQLEVMREDVVVTEFDLLRPHSGEITEAGLRTNISVGIQYLEAWLRGIGCVPLYNLMEDAATAEISRSQVWQWLNHKAVLADGQTVTGEFVAMMIRGEFDKIQEEMGAEKYAASKLDLATELFARIIFSKDFTEFLTLPAYEHLKHN
ncbi:MAG: malate synthase A [bacterium]|nr:malate synthase A [bacterium]